MKEDFKIVQTLSLTEYLDTMFYELRKMKWIRRIFIFSCIMGILNALLDSLLPSKHQVPWYIFLFKMIFPPVFFVIFLLVAGILVSFFIMQFRSQMFRNVTFEFTHWGVIKSGKGFEFSAQWEKFLTFKETYHFIYLYVSAHEAHIIKKNAFANGDELNGFLQMLHKKFIE
jgi:uncharacterized membrane protein YvlD (DUF360 family)